MKILSNAEYKRLKDIESKWNYFYNYHRWYSDFPPLDIIWDKYLNHTEEASFLDHSSTRYKFVQAAANFDWKGRFESFRKR